MTSPAPAPTPYDLMGGEAGIRRLVDRFYDIMDSAPEAATIRALHAASLKASREKLRLFMTGWTGGPQLYVEKLVTQLDGLVEAGNTVIVVEHHMRVVAGSDWVMDIGPGAGEEGGHVVASGPPAEVARSRESRTAPYLARYLKEARVA